MLLHLLGVVPHDILKLKPVLTFPCHKRQNIRYYKSAEVSFDYACWLHHMTFMVTIYKKEKLISSDLFSWNIEEIITVYAKFSCFFFIMISGQGLTLTFVTLCPSKYSKVSNSDIKTFLLYTRHVIDPCHFFKHTQTHTLPSNPLFNLICGFIHNLL